MELVCELIHLVLELRDVGINCAFCVVQYGLPLLICTSWGSVTMRLIYEVCRCLCVVEITPLQFVMFCAICRLVHDVVEFINDLAEFMNDLEHISYATRIQCIQPLAHVPQTGLPGLHRVPDLCGHASP